MSLVGAAFPRFFQAGVDGASAVIPMARKLLKRTLVLGVVAVVGMFFLAPILPHLIGNSYREAVSALRWLCLIPIFRCFSLSAGDALSGAGDQKFRLICQTAAALGNGLLNLYLIPRYSWHGAAWASLLTDGGLGLMNWVALIYLARPARSVKQRPSANLRADAKTLLASTHESIRAEKEVLHATKWLTMNSPNRHNGLRVFVHLARGFGRSAWKQQWEQGKIVGINHDNPYGYRLAEEMGCAVQQSEDLPETSVKRLLRLAVRAILGFDFIHAWSNRQGIFAAQIVWTHTESQSLAVLLLARLFPSASKGIVVIAQTVWVMDNWASYSLLRRALYGSLLRRAGMLTFLSSSAAAQARQLFPDMRVEFVRYGIRADQPLAIINRATHAPIRVLSLGNDRHRDWTTFVNAIRNDSRYVARIATSAKLDKLLANVDNIHREKAKTNAELMGLFGWADIVVVCLVDNLHASGITVIEEAVLCGLPVIATDVGGLRSYFTPEEITYVPAKEPESLRSAIESLMANDELRRRKAETALARMKDGELNSWSFVARHVELSRGLLQVRQDEGCSETLATAVKQ
jgi:glycosyltransferase involved in cell wall biosynthesis